MLPVQRFGNDVIQSHIHVSADISIIVLVDCQGSRCVLYKQEQHSDLHSGQARFDVRQEFLGDEMASFAPFRKRERLLPGHDGVMQV